MGRYNPSAKGGQIHHPEKIQKARETFTTERLVERREDGVSKLKKGQRAEQSDERNEESSVSYLLIYQRVKLEF